MLIKIAFDSIKDEKLIKTVTQTSEDEFPLGQIIETHYKEYVESALTDIIDLLPNNVTQLKYSGQLYYIGNEVFEIEGYRNPIKISSRFFSYQDAPIHLEVSIECTPNGDFLEEKYSKLLEVLKRCIKDRFLKDWKRCTWIADEQSALLGTELFSEIYRTENNLRAFAATILIHSLGIDWIHRPGLEKYAESTEKQKDSFIQRIPEFSDINTEFYSMTLETLLEIIFKGEVFDDVIPVDWETYNNILRAAEHGRKDNVKGCLDKKRILICDIWEQLFKNCFVDPEKFKSDINAFTLDRNHVYHNKLITWSAYENFKKHIDAINKEIKEAAVCYEEISPSEEFIDMKTYEEEQQEESIESEKEYYRYRISSETGLEIRDSSEIFDMFIETLSNIHEIVYRYYNLDEGFNVSEYSIPAKDKKSEVFRVICNAAEASYISISSSITIDDDLGGISTLLIIASDADGKEITRAQVDYTNGDGTENDEGLMTPTLDSEYNDQEVERFIKELEGYITEDLNPYIRKLDCIAYERKETYGLVADFPCENCGKNYISTDEELAPLGTCIYCGYENEYRTCLSCGTIYGPDEGDANFCPGCLDKIEKE